MTAEADQVVTEQKREKDTAEEVRKKAMEKMGETKKRKLSASGDETPKGRRRCAQPLIEFLQEKAAADRELRQQELEAKQKEQENQQQMMRAIMEQQGQMNQAFLSVVQTLLNK